MYCIAVQKKRAEKIRGDEARNEGNQMLVENHRVSRRFVDEVESNGSDDVDRMNRKSEKAGSHKHGKSDERIIASPLERVVIMRNQSKRKEVAIFQLSCRNACCSMT